MKRIGKIALFGFVMWLIPFVVFCFISPWKTSHLVLFESVMAVVVTLTAVLLATAYLRQLDRGFLQEGAIIGVVWLAMCIVFDLLLFMEGPMKMSFADYIMDVGIVYLMIPTITIGMGYLADTTMQPD